MTRVLVAENIGETGIGTGAVDHRSTTDQQLMRHTGIFSYFSSAASSPGRRRTSVRSAQPARQLRYSAISSSCACASSRSGSARPVSAIVVRICSK